ncbi:MAG: energy-coupling factor ABC transporter ATP-binding protein [Candidatus Aminicenantia bacterium]
MPSGQEELIYEVRNISFSYDSTRVLEDISFSVRKGEKIVILGINGCGKTSLLKLLNGLLTPEKGEIYYKDVKIEMSSGKNFMRNFRKDVGFLFQNPESMFFNPTVKDEIAFGPKEFGLEKVEERVKKLSEELKISHLLEKEPYELSGGEKKKVALASVLSFEPETILLDEPSAGLDPSSVAWLVDFIIKSDKTFITATQNLSLAEELGERFFIISPEHKLIFDGNFEEFFNNKEILLLSGLGHFHTHIHRRRSHSHLHFHDWD